MRVAIFDFDGTLYAKETFNVLMDHLKHHPVYKGRYKRFYRGVMPPYIGYKLKLYPEAKMKERSMQAYLSAFEKLPLTDMTLYFQELAEKMRTDFNPAVVSRLKDHAAKGDYVMVVSGAFTPLLHEVTDGLPINEIIGTEISYKADSLDTRTPIRHIQSERKIEEIKSALADHEVDWKSSFSYSDSISDLPILKLTGNAVAVQPDNRLREIALKEGWEIL